jgi:hypothetical protein
LPAHPTGAEHSAAYNICQLMIEVIISGDNGPIAVPMRWQIHPGVVEEIVGAAKPADADHSQGATNTPAGAVLILSDALADSGAGFMGVPGTPLRHGDQKIAAPTPAP